MQIAPEIFKAYDIRGVVDTQLTQAAVTAIGKALGTLARARQCTTIVIGRDGRLSGPRLSAALAQGIQSTGVDVIDVGVVATPMVYFAAVHFNTGCGVMVTGSHNPPDYNGLKMVIGNETLALDDIQGLLRTIHAQAYAAGAGGYEVRDIGAAYLDRIVSDVKLTRPMHIVVDCGNGSPGAFAPTLFRRLGCTVTELFCDVDGHFPNHHPDPSQPKNLQDVIKALAQGEAEVGLAFDGDGDRLGVVTKEGHIIYPDRQLMLFAEDVLKRVPGAEIIFDVKCTRHLWTFLRARGGRPLMWKTGHSLIKHKMKETGAPLAGEMSGHMFFKERWYGFDDGLYAGARLLEILSRAPNRSAVSALLDGLPDAISTPELNIKLAEGENHALIARLQQQALFASATEVNTIDGVRAEYVDGFGLARASNTTPVIVLRFEGDNEAAIERIKAEFRAVLTAAKPDIALNF
jgi:phosphomannomutase / phosphoglucomutase